MKFPVANYVVMMHHQKAGTFAPAFPTLDEAEEFSNAMRAVTDGIAISEPVPVVITTSGKEDQPLGLSDDFVFHPVKGIIHRANF